jgi:homoserine acetyltransferase
MQPYDGYDVTTIASASAGGALQIFFESFGLAQAEYGIVPAIQAILVLHWTNGSRAVFGTSAAANGGWLASAADALRNPSGNKGDPGW